jgi:hypothetical protein
MFRTEWAASPAVYPGFIETSASDLPLRANVQTFTDFFRLTSVRGSFKVASDAALGSYYLAYLVYDLG